MRVVCRPFLRDCLSLQAKEAELSSREALVKESDTIKAVIDEHATRLEPAVAACQLVLREEIAAAEERADKELHVANERHRKDWEASNNTIEQLKTQQFLDNTDLTNTLKMLNKSLDEGLTEMEGRVDEAMSTCDMNVLLTESNSIALVEATAERVDLFEANFYRRIDLIEGEEGPLVKIQEYLTEVGAMAKATSTQLKQTMEPALAAVERKQGGAAAQLSVLKTKSNLEAEEWRDSLRGLGREVHSTMDELEERVDEVCSAAEMNNLLNEMAHYAHHG